MKYMTMLIAGGILLVVVTVVIGVRFSDGPVTEHHYEQGLAYDKTKAFIKETGLAPSIDSVTRQGRDVELDFTVDHGPGVTVELVKAVVGTPVSGTPPAVGRVERTASPEHRYRLRYESTGEGYFFLRIFVRIGKREGKREDKREVRLQKSFYLPPAARGSFKKPPLDPAKLLINRRIFLKSTVFTGEERA